ncbi:Tn3 family transposase [Glaciimonas sp. CA11.2]|uniref:Tn3 family transposase n=1 Tax=Glaciimonas sp. CA11.2 TaxID=3048601 RepID=UPI002AB4147B|nr:Tn3 family transposase [Glaciimonas sp. CA11.2]MDY7549136.1 Tn3 family transposase [Glaciimonas sp. CA11.2]MEB0162382.1 Tn3 family transposase [Glaciimonas sp. CA11.2]
MPVNFLTPSQIRSHGRYDGPPTVDELSRYFHLDDTDHALINTRREKHTRLGFALQLATVRFLGTFLDDPADVPNEVIRILSQQLAIDDGDYLSKYRNSRQRWEHAAEIRRHYGYREFAEYPVGFRLGRWLYALCWTGTDRPSVLFEHATTWLLTGKVLLPGATVLERFIARLRQRVETRLWRMLAHGLSLEQRMRLDDLLTVPAGNRNSTLDRLRTGPVMVSASALVRALLRIEAIRALEIRLPGTAKIPPSRIAALARFANTSKVTVVSRLPEARRMATLVAFVYTLEATAQDDALEVMEILLHQLFSGAMKVDQKARLRSLKDLDAAATVLAQACAFLLDVELPDKKLRATVFEKIQQERLAEAMQKVSPLVRPPQDVFYRELHARYLRVRRFLPSLLQHIHVGAGPAGRTVLEAIKYLHVHEIDHKRKIDPPMAIVTKAWLPHVIPGEGRLDQRAYMFCALDQLRSALRRRDVFAEPSWRYADPRKGLLSDADWTATRPVICRTLGFSSDVTPVLAGLATELDQTYRAVAARLPENPAVRIVCNNEQHDLVLSPLDKIEEPSYLLALRAEVAARLPRVDVAEILLEIAARTDFAEAFTHVSEREARAADLVTSVCAVLLAESCNTGFEPLVRQDVAALRRDRLSWVNQNYIRDETLIAVNMRLVSAQNKIGLAHACGGGEVASADGMRFVVPVRTVHAGPNPKYFGIGRGVTWYNMLSSQFTGLNAITVPGTLRDSLVLLAVVLEQQTELQPTHIMTDTGAYTDIIFGLFRLLGYRFSPRLANVGGTRFWRIDPDADYGPLDKIAKQRVNMALVAEQWDDILRLIGSLKLGRIPATGIMRTLQVGDRPTRLAKALAEFGRIEKSLHTLTFIDDETKRRNILIQLNRGESRHALARAIFHGKRGELHQRYREGQEDQLGALGLVANVIVLWNTIYMEAILNKLRCEGYVVIDEDVARLSPLIHEHINMMGRYSFAVPESVLRGELRPLRSPGDTDRESIP